MSLESTDNFIVQRGSSLYKVNNDDAMSKIKDDDLLLVGRGSNCYKITGEEFKNSSVPPTTAPILGDITITEQNPNENPRFTNQEFATSISMVENGQPASYKKIDAYVTGVLESTIYGDTISSVGETIGSNGAVWSDAGDTLASDNAYYLPSVANNQLFVGRGGNLYTFNESTRKVNPTPIFTTTSSNYLHVAYMKGMYYLFEGNSNKYYTSTTATAGSWTERNVESGVTFRDTYRPITTTEDQVIIGADNGNSDLRVYFTDGGTGLEYFQLNDCSGFYGLAFDALRGQICIGGTNTNNRKGLFTTPVPVSRDSRVEHNNANTQNNVTSVLPVYDAIVTAGNPNVYYFANPNEATFSTYATKLSYARALVFDGNILWAFGESVGCRYAFVDPGSPDGLSNFLAPTGLSGSWQAMAGAAVLFKGAVYAGMTNSSYSNSYLQTTTVTTAYLELSSNLNFEYVGTIVTEEGGAASAFVTGVDIAQNRIYITQISGTFTDGRRLSFGKRTLADTKKYLRFDGSGQVTDLLDTPQTPEYITFDPNPSITFKFPSFFPSGETPDEEMKSGTTFSVEVTASNGETTVGPKIKTILPEGVDPPPASGVFKADLYSGGIGATDRRIGIDFVNETGIVWNSQRSGGSPLGWSYLTDSFRGPREIFIPSTTQQPSAKNVVTNFYDDGYQIGTDGLTNGSGRTFVNWCIGGGFQFLDIVEFSGNGGVQTIPHNLGTKPGFMIIINKTSASNWYVYHSQAGRTEYAWLNSNNAFNTDVNAWNAKAPTVFDFTVGSTFANGTYIAYLFAEDTPNLIKCGKYTGASANNPISVGFKAQFVMIKGISRSGNWVVVDTARGFDNWMNVNLQQNEQNKPMYIEEYESGFTVNTGNTDINYSGDEYAYVAIADASAKKLTPEEFAEQAITFGTYEHRKKLYGAEQAQSERDALIQQFASQGYTLEDILEYL